MISLTSSPIKLYLSVVFCEPRASVGGGRPNTVFCTYSLCKLTRLPDRCRRYHSALDTNPLSRSKHYHLSFSFSRTTGHPRILPFSLSTAPQTAPSYHPPSRQHISLSLSRSLKQEKKQSSSGEGGNTKLTCASAACTARGGRSYGIVWARRASG